MRTQEATAMRVVLFIAFFLLCCSGVFAQQQNVVEVPLKLLPEQKVAATEAQMELLFWVLGSRQGRGTNDEFQKTTSQKKQMINSGMAPNRILSRTFLNKAINYESTVT